MEGTPFGRYRLIELLGRGGMGEVWRAYDTETDRTVALKLLPEHWLQNRMFQERFRREAHTAARLNDPHIVPIHHYGDIDGRLYVDMRLVDGRDLESMLTTGSIDPQRAVAVIAQIAKALHAAHKVGLVHRDVKPSNILVDEDDFAYLIDFGIARAINESGLTDTGAVIGTWHYMAPERLSGAEADARSDIYALACVLYECLTGRRPFPGDSVESQVAAHLTSPPPRPSTTDPDVPPRFDDVIATGMAKSPAARYPTTIELARAAQDALSPPVDASTHFAPTEDARRWPDLTPTLANDIPPTGRRDSDLSVLADKWRQSIAPWLRRALSGRRRWIAALLLVLVATAGAAGLLSALYVNTDAVEPIQIRLADEDWVRNTIQDFDTSVQKGDLATLRAITCGATHDRYANYDEQAWAEAYAKVAAAKQYPVVASIDRVVVHGDQAEANVTTFMAYAPQTRSARSFDLQRIDGAWKICQAP